MSDWEKWVKEGDQYFKAAGGDSNKPSRFSTTIQYNILAQSLESYVMAILGYHNSFPDNHTFTDFVEALDRVHPLAPALRERILRHENIQRICSFTDYSRKQATVEQILDFRNAVNEIADLAHTICVSGK